MKRSALILLLAVGLTLISLGIAHAIWPTVPSASIAGVVALGSVLVAVLIGFIFEGRK